MPDENSPFDGFVLLVGNNAFDIFAGKEPEVDIRELLTGLDWLRLPGSVEFPEHSFQSYVVQLRSQAPVTRPELIEHLLAQDIPCQAGAKPIHRYRPFCDDLRVPLPVAEAIGESAVFLPMHAALSEAQIDRVSNALRQALDATRAG